MFDKFVKEIDVLTNRRTTMGIQEFLLERAKKEIRKELRKELRNEKEVEFVKKLLTSTDFSASKIAALVGVSEDFVMNIKKESGL